MRKDFKYLGVTFPLKTDINCDEGGFKNLLTKINKHYKGIEWE